MKELIARDDMGVFADGNETLRVDSRDVARLFGKEHKHVLESIDRLTAEGSGLSADFGRSNFRPISYTDSQNRRQRACAMTRDGFFMLVFGFNGKKAIAIREAYIRRFNEMEAQIASLKSARCQFPLLTERIKAAHEHPKAYHYSNECDMLNRLALGMTASEFRDAREDVPDDAKSIRPFLSPEQIALLEELQHADIAYLAVWPDNHHARLEALLTYMEARGYRPLWTGPKRAKGLRNERH